MPIWLRAFTDTLPEGNKTIPLKVIGEFDLGFLNSSRRVFVTQNHGLRPYREIEYLSESPATPVSADVVEQSAHASIEAAAKVDSEKNYPLPDEKMDEFMVYTLRKAREDGFLAGASHNSHPSVSVLVDALRQILYMKLRKGEKDTRYTFNRCWHLANDALQQFSQPVPGKKDDGQLWNKVVAMVAAADIAKVNPSDPILIKTWKERIIETLKQQYIITKK